MATASKDSQHLSTVSERMNIPGTPSMVISLMTGSLLVALLGTRALAEVFTQVGLASEELFRGERLPNLPHAPQRTPSSDLPEY
ncbi:MAG TPA: hypothetical protein V6D02_16615 [Candidatus Obscuribacterales bacterium]